MELYSVVVVTLFSLRHDMSVGAIAERRMEDKCDRKLDMWSESLDQGRLVLSTKWKFDLPRYKSYSENSVCDIHIEARNSGNKIMFYFEHLKLKCSVGYLQFFDGELWRYSARSKRYSDRSTLIPGIPKQLCGFDMPSGVFTTNKKFLRVRYVSKKRGSWTDVVQIIFTSFQERPDGSCPSHKYECANGRCIDDDVACNGFNSCGDNSSCRLSDGTIVGIVIGTGCGIIATVVCIICIRCIKRKPAQLPGTTWQSISAQPIQYMHPQATMVPNQPLAPGQYPMQAQYGVIPQGPIQYGAPVIGVSPSGSLSQGCTQCGAPTPGAAQYGVTSAPTQYGAPAPGMAPCQTPTPSNTTNSPPAYNTLFSEQEHSKLLNESKASAPPIE